MSSNIPPGNMSGTNYFAVFIEGTGLPSPFTYQCRLACGPDAKPSDAESLRGGTACESQLIQIPTGCGKTAAVVMAWLWNRVLQPNTDARAQWPRRLVFCLPMRTLVEQTRDNVRTWLSNLGDREWKGEGKHDGKVGLHVLMGGEEKTDWDLYPEHDAILIGTQDMLLSRALNRGYGMSRYRWPMHFGLLNSDCLWVLDETQLMGVGVETSAQLDAFRASSTLSQCPTWWMSATLDQAQLATVDHKNPESGWPTISLTESDRALPAVRARIEAKKTLTLRHSRTRHRRRPRRLLRRAGSRRPSRLPTARGHLARPPRPRRNAGSLSKSSTPRSIQQTTQQPNP